MNLEEFTKEKLWLILIETVHSTVMYPSHKGYTREKLLREKPDLGATELSVLLHMPLGEALVILDELKSEAKAADQNT